MTVLCHSIRCKNGAYGCVVKFHTFFEPRRTTVQQKQNVFTRVLETLTPHFTSALRSFVPHISTMGAPIWVGVHAYHTVEQL